MPWKERLDHLIADGEQAAHIESKEILGALLAQSAEARWQVVLTQDPCLKCLIPADYQSLLKTTATPRSSEITEGLAVASSRLGEQWEQHSEHITKTIESSLARLEQHAQDLTKTVESSHAQWGERLDRRLNFRLPLRFLLLVLTLGLAALVILHSNITSSPGLLSERGPQDLAKVMESSQARFGELLDRRSQDLTKVVESSQARWLEQWEQHASFRPSVWIFFWVLIPSVIWWLVFRSRLSPWSEFGRNQKDDLVKAVKSSQAEWGERLEQRSEDLMNALESSQNQMDVRLEQVLYEAAERQEHQRETLWRVMAVEELGLKLIEGNDFQSELTALQAVWDDSEVLPQLEPAATRGVPGRPLLFLMLERLYSDLLIRREEKETTKHPFWNAWLPLFHNNNEIRGRVGKMENRVAHALEELRRGNWDAAIDELASVEYAPIWRWAETARDRLDLEQWYADLRHEVWQSHSGIIDPKERILSSLACAKTCRIPFCKPGRLCLKQLLIRFKNVSEKDSFPS